MPISTMLRVALVGIGATVILDLWLGLLKRFGVPVLDFALLGRWLGHASRGYFLQPALAQAPPVRHEKLVGWSIHYAIGIVFAALLLLLQGRAWLQSPSLLPAVLFGVCTVAAPLFVLQPAMGAGLAASKTRTPVKTCARSIVNHAVFGMGLYLSAVVTAGL